MINKEYSSLFKDKTILITGGTGYLGRALTQEILNYNPHSIRIFSRDEVKHHRVQEKFDDSRLRNLIGDVRDFKRLRKACEDADIVIHAAALKRLDILEYNVEESVKTNIVGTLNVVNACLDADVEKAIFISTDKACSPVNSYGACKFVSERIFTESNYNKGRKKTIFTCVRYGNVLESTGSVIPFFESKIRDGKKIPITDKNMTRFIISPEQAVELIFKALKYSIGGEVFVPKLPAFRIMDLVEILKENNNSDPGIEIIGIRPGEKLHELMVNKYEVPRTFDFKDLYVITSSIDKYLDHPQAEYFSKNKILQKGEDWDYSSKDAVIEKKDIKKLFKSFGLL
jgi:UDP-N-acetylglucosamine 4,6-dehydratase/5-epimerase